MSITALILAAGEGTRMKSDHPKVAHEVLGVPMVSLVVQAARDAGCSRVVVVTGHKAEVVEALIPDVPTARQCEQLGTGHAVMCARDELGAVTGSLLVLSGDTPLLRASTIAALVAAREASNAAIAVLTTCMDDPAGYGRIVCDADGSVAAIVEHKDASSEQMEICEINTGTYCFDAEVLFAHLDKLSTDNAQGEFYLTDMVSIFRQEGLGVVASATDDPAETLGVNSRVQLAQATKVMQGRINEQHMLAGVTMVDPALVWISPGVEIGRDVVLEPMTFLSGATTVADRAHLGPNTRVHDSQIGVEARVDASVLDGAVVGEQASVGPVSYLRAGTVLEAGAKAGACVEIKKSTVGEGSKVPHLSYIGDATIGKGVNVGAGSITCNYDGANKHQTIIGDGAFIGSDTMLIAPVTIGRGSVTGAASAISRDVPDHALAVERSEQRILEGWAERRRTENNSNKAKGSGTNE